MANDAGSTDSNDLGGLAAAAADDTVVEKDTIEDTKEHTRPRENRDYMLNGKEVPIPDTGKLNKEKFFQNHMADIFFFIDFTHICIMFWMPFFLLLSVSHVCNCSRCNVILKKHFYNCTSCDVTLKTISAILCQQFFKQ